MGTLFTLTDAIREVTQAALDDLITELGKTVRLVYPPLRVECGCAGNAWVTGGPFPTPGASPCALCGGTGYRAEVTTEDLLMLVAAEPSRFFRPLPRGTQVPDGTIQVKFFLSNLPKVKQAQELILQPELEQVARWRYVLDGDPIDVSNIVRGRYAVAQLRRVP
jgi:hypothetical protein